jgi:hypothetical protein
VIWRIIKREWGAATFVITVLIGAVAVAISLLVNGAHTAAVAPPPPCPSYSPYPSLSPGQTVAPTPIVSPTPFNAAFAGCPSPPLPPTNPPTPTPKPGTTPTPTPTPAGPSTPTPTAIPTAVG